MSRRAHAYWATISFGGLCVLAMVVLAVVSAAAPTDRLGKWLLPCMVGVAIAVLTAIYLRGGPSKPHPR